MTGYRPPPLPAGSMPGELFPEVPEYREDTAREARLDRHRTKARQRVAQAQRKVAEGDLMAAQDILVDVINNCDPSALPAGAVATLRAVQKKILTTRPASGPSPKQLAQQKKSAKTLLDKASRLAKGGKLVEAQSALLALLNRHDRRAWPDGAISALQDVREKIRTATPPGKAPPPAELARQKRSAEALLARAEALIAEGNNTAAQKPLLEILNAHHPKAWPPGTMATFKKAQADLKQATDTVPTFFGIEGGK